MGFPDDADLGTVVELNLGGAWTDVTSFTRLAKKITITRGRADYSSQVNETKVAAQLRNTDGRFSQYNPTGPYYGLLTRNTPLRVSVAAGSPFLDHPESSSGIDRRISTPSTTALQITGDLDVRWDVEVTDWDTTDVVELGGKWGSAGQQSWHAYVFAGTLRMGWTTDGTTEHTAAAPLSTTVHQRRMCLRATMDVDNGSGGRTVRFYTGTSLSGPWTQIGGDNVVSGTAATASSTAPVEIGDVTSTGFAHAAARIYAAQIRAGIDGTLVAAPDLTAQQSGVLSFTDSAGVPWTANDPTAITNRTVRGTGEVPSWPGRWGASGKLATVDVTASGILRRLRQGSTPLDSPMRRSVTAAGPLAYWPMEDGTSATQAASALIGGRPMQPLRSGPQFAAATDSPAGSLALPDFSNGGTLYATVPAGSAASWTVDCLVKFPTSLPEGFAAALGWTATGNKANVWEIDAFPAGGGGLAIQWADWNFATLGGPYNSNVTVTDGQWHHIRVTVAQSGTAITIQAWIDNTLVINTSEASVTLGPIRDVTANPYAANDAGVPAMGHVAVWSPSTNVVTVPAVTGYDGETTDARLVRLADEESVPLLTPYGPAGDAELGPQGPDALLSLLQESVDADVGVLYEPRDVISLAARPRVSLYNQVPALVLDYAQQQVAPPLEPEDDDQATRNDITRSRPNGSSARVTLDDGPMSTAAPPDGVGRYQDSGTVNVYADDQLPLIAGWLLNLGTYNGIRYPQVTILLHRCPELIDAARAVDIGDRIQILNLPVWLPPGGADLIVQGITETPGVRTWQITFVCTPAGPWTVGVLDDDVLGRADTAGSELAAAAGETDTVLSVATTAGPLWVTDPAEFPLDLAVGGEVVTAVAPGQTLNVNPRFDVDASDWRGINAAVGWTPATWSHSGGALVVTSTAGSSPRAECGAQAVTAGQQYRAYGWLYAPAALPGGAELNINWFNGGTYLSTSTNARTMPTGVAQLYDMTATAPATATRADLTVVIHGTPGAGQVLQAGEARLIPVSSYAASPQTLTVVRSVNGVRKAQPAGADVRLATPMILAL